MHFMQPRLHINIPHRRMQPIYGYGSRTSATFASAAGLQDTYFVEDPISDVKEVGSTRRACLHA